jgi:Flp pilus assembly protein TadB
MFFYPSIRLPPEAGDCGATAPTTDHIKRKTMSKETRQYLYSVMRQAAYEFKYMGKKALHGLMRTPLPKLLIVCIGLFLLVTLIPLVLSLFVVFLLLKLLLIVVVLAVRSSRRAPPELRYWRDRTARHKS